MSIPKSWWVASGIGLLVAALSPVVGWWWRGGPGDRCDLDGVQLIPNLSVHIVDERGHQHRFCSLTCGERWLSVSGREPTEIFVTDEVTGKQLAAAEAHYVRSRIVTHSPNRELRHVFGRQSDAEAHAADFQGRVLTDANRPFAKWLRK